MKKIILPALLIGAAISFTSCKKDRTCDCVSTTTTTDFEGETTSSSTNFSNTQKSNKKDAEAWCDELDSYEFTSGFGGFFTTTTAYSCELK